MARAAGTEGSMSSPTTPATRAFYDAEAQVLARYGLRPQVRHLRLRDPGMSVRVVETGSDTSEPLVFLHGICLASAHWAPVVARLGARRCIAIDMPGHGGSDGADFTGVDLRRWHVRMLAGCRRLLARSLGRHAIDAAPPELIRATYLGTRRRDLARTVSTYLREQFRGVAASPPRYLLHDEELARIQRPVLVIWGDRDDRYQPLAKARRKTSCIPTARFELVPGGHEPWLDDPAPCARLIAVFVDDHASGVGRSGTGDDGTTKGVA